MIAGEKENSIFFNHSFDKKRLKALISWVFKKSGEAEALRVLDLLKETGFQNATRAGISIGLHDLTTPATKSWLISESQQSMNNTDRDFVGAKITATERSQRIIDTWHRASESLSKQVVDYFGTYDAFNPVYIMALSGARGNFSQVRQLIGMRGLMADQQGKIVNFPIRSNLREGLTITEYFISCSGARKGLVDTALRTADTGYLTRRLVDVSHHVVVKRIRCNTNRGIVFKDLQSYNKILLSLKERLVGRVLAENILINTDKNRSCLQDFSKAEIHQESINDDSKFILQSRHERAKKGSKHVRAFVPNTFAPSAEICKALAPISISNNLLAEKDREINPELALKITQHRNKVLIRSPLTCAFTHEVCQLCYGWSISQGSLVSLGDAVGVIAAQSIGEPGTQLTMRTFHTGGVFSGDLLQEVRAPHAGRIEFSKAFQGLLIRTGHGRIAFLSKASGSLFLIKDESMDIQISDLSDRSIDDGQKQKKDSPVPSAEISAEIQKKSISASPKFTALHRLPTDRLGKETHSEANFTTITIQPFTMLFVRQGEFVKKNSLLAEYSIQRKEGNQPIKTEQTLFAGLSGRVIEDRSGKTYLKYLKESSLLTATLRNYMSQSALQAQHIRSSFCSPTLYNSNKSSILSTPKRIVPSVTDTNVPRCTLKSTSVFNFSESDCTNRRFVKLKAEIKSNSRAEFINTRNKKFTVQDICKTQLLISYKAEDLENDLFRYIEPVKSGRLGFLKILSTRVGATFDYTCPITPFNFYKHLQNSFFKHAEWTYNRLINKVLLARHVRAKLDPNLALKDLEKNCITTKYLHPEFVKDNLFFLRTIAEYGDILDEDYKYKI